VIAALVGLLCAVVPEEREASFDIWDWTAPCQDLALFETWTADLVAMGFNRIEISVPWKHVEPRRGQYEIKWLSERLAVCKRHGAGMRLRINSYYGGATPDWYDGDTWVAADGSPVPQKPPSIMDERFWSRFAPLCTTLARACAGEDVYFSPFIGIHAELKWSEWWSYDPSTLAAWRKAIASPRPAWLRDVVERNTPLPEKPPVPGPTQGVPDRNPANRAWIAFREQCWREAVERFAAAVRAGDPKARLSAPLGESYRKESAAMSNLDYWGLSRGMDQIVHSYDFFWHVKDDAWAAAAAVDSFRGIAQRPVQFEFDAYQSTIGLGYSHGQLLAIGRQAAQAGAGLKVANYSYNAEMPSTFPLLRDLVSVFAEHGENVPHGTNRLVSRKDTVLLFLSKWTHYSYREANQWVHDAQFGVYKLFRDLEIPVRIVNEDNLSEDLSGYRLLFKAFSPRALLPQSAQERLDRHPMPVIADLEGIPPLYAESAPLPAEGIARLNVAPANGPIGPTDLASMGNGYAFALNTAHHKLAAHKPGSVILGYPIGLLYLRDSEPRAHREMIRWAMERAGTSR